LLKLIAADGVGRQFVEFFAIHEISPR
jgi:hypothetical protein